MKKTASYTLHSTRPEEVGYVPLALQCSDNAKAVIIEGDAFGWTQEAIIAFGDIWREAQARGRERRHLPFASLRALLELFVESSRRIDRQVGLDDWSFRRDAPEDITQFIWTDQRTAETQKWIEAAIDEWLPNSLVESFTAPLQIQQRYVDRIYELQQANRLIAAETQRIRVLPWEWSQDTGTTHAKDAQTDFAGMVDFAARMLAGEELFAGLGPVRRLVVNDSSSGTAELMTNPRAVDDKGTFSLVVRLEVVTFPAIHQPVLRVDFSKRRWLQRLSERVFGHETISGFAFPVSPTDRSLGFRLIRERSTNNRMVWRPDHAFDGLRRKLHLPLLQHDAASICSGSASTADCDIRLVHRPGLSDQEPRIKVGVPEIDKLEAFEKIAERLSEHGLTPFQAYERIETHHKSSASQSDVINAPTLLGAALEWPGLPEEERTLTPEYLKSLKPSELDDLLHKRFRFGLASIQHGQHLANFENQFGDRTADQADDLLGLIDENASAVRRLYGTQRPQLVILHDPQEVIGINLLQSIVRVLWGDAIDIRIQRLPAGVHGPRDVLAGAAESRTERFRQRVDSWRQLAESIATEGRSTLCLVMARDFYSDANGKGKPDDTINKAAARKALSVTAKATVQYLLPPETDRDESIRLTEFFYRAQSALKDLISAHSGRVDGVAEGVARCFGADETAPGEIIGLTVIRRNQGRVRGGLENTFLPVAFRIEVASGQCSIRYAYDLQGRMQVSDWRPFSVALGEIAGISPVSLAATQRERRTRFMQFCDAIITDSVESGTQPVILIDSTNCAKLWGWLTDARISAADIEIGERQWMQENWRGARIVRIRQELSPGILVDKVLRLNQTGKKKRKAVVRVPTSPGAGTLFRLTTPDSKKCATYLSVGGKSLHQHKRGLSCYRPVLLPTRSSTNGNEFTLQERKPSFDQWPTPNPLEIVVAFRQQSDNPDSIAEFVETLRYGFGHYSEWTALPAPLFFERVVRDYISGFTLADRDDLMLETSATDESVSPSRHAVAKARA